MSLIGTIAFVGIPSYFAQARDYSRKKDLKDLAVVMEYYYDAASAYPLSIPSCGEPLLFREKIILDSFPCDPKTNESYMYITDEYTEYQWYKIYTHLERNADLSIPLIGCFDGCGPECAYNFGVASSNISVTACLWSQAIASTIPSEPTHPPSDVSPTIIPSETPSEIISEMPLNYVCAPGGGTVGSCEVFDDPDRSLCPFVYLDDPSCQNQCDNKDNRCRNASGKYKPE